ncbi:MAG TPA: ATP-binding protein [Anaerolineaceae bacterium]|nr:ATP-binding protein [Anaerolineaceae bacterium]HPN52099.1 ATP-binding protein [Anaerolineaceae bacterium]
MNESILIAAPDTQMIYLLERILSSAQYRTASATSVGAAVAALTRQPVQMVLVHQNLPDANGMELARWVREKYPMTVVLMIAQRDDPDLLKTAMRLGVADFLSPPITPDLIINAVRQGMEHYQRLAAVCAAGAGPKKDESQELDTVLNLGRDIIASLDLDSVLRTVVNACVSLTKAEEGSLLLLDESTGELYMHAARNFNEDFVNTFRLPVQDSLAGSVVRTGQPILLDEEAPKKIKTSYLVHSLIYVPLRQNDRVMGVLGVDNRIKRESFTEHDLKLVSILASYAVLAIENARVFALTSIERNRMEAIFTSVQDGVIVIDDEKKVLLLNPTAYDAFMFEMEGIKPVGKTVGEIFKQTELLDLIANPEMQNRAEVALDNGCIYSVQAAPVPSIGMVITMHDITHIKRLDRIKSEFVGTVSHDLRSPLTAILGYVELIDRVGPVNEIQRDFIRRVQASVHNITALIDDLLNLGRIESGFDIRKEAVELSGIVRYVLEEIEGRILNKSLKMECELPPAFPQFFGHPGQIRQMVENLVDNAVKYTPDGGRVQVKGRLEGNQIIFQVSDTGLGIPTLDLPHIFDKFYRASNVPPTSTGTGLGLAIVKSIVESHQGRIWVDSVPGQGTTFTVVLPVTVSLE